MTIVRMTEPPAREPTPPPVASADTPALSDPLLRLLATRGGDGVTARDLLRARLCPDAAAARARLAALADAGQLLRREHRPAHGGKMVVTYHASRP